MLPFRHTLQSYKRFPLALLNELISCAHLTGWLSCRGKDIHKVVLAYYKSPFSFLFVKPTVCWHSESCFFSSTFPKYYFKKTKVLTVWPLVLSGWHCQPPLLPALLLKPFFSVLRSFQSVANLILGSHPVLNLLLIQSFLASWVFFKALAILCKCTFHNHFSEHSCLWSKVEST